MDADKLITVKVLDKDTGNVGLIDLEEYVIGVVIGEMPTDWPMEALRAQAVAVRSYTVYCLDNPRHKYEGAHICNDPKHCQNFTALISDNAAEAAGSTDGLVLKYDGEVIAAYYGGCCGGHTKNCEDVWLQKLPYIRGVSCPCDGKIRGHRLGMCQEGARVMAAAGKSYIEILQHYYTDVDIGPI